MRGAITRSVGLNTITGIAGPAAGIIVAPILARDLGAEARGDVAGLLAPLLILTTALSFGIPESVTFHVSKYLGLDRKAWATALSWAALGSAMSIGLTLFWFETIYSRNDQAVVLVALAMPPSIFAGLVRGYAGGKHRWDLVAADRLVSAAARLISTILLSTTGALNVVSATALMALTPVVGTIVYIRAAECRARAAVGRRSTASLRSELLPASSTGLVRFALGVWPGALVGILLARVDQLVLGPLSNSTELGIYAVSVTISEMSLIFNSALRDVLFAAEAKSNDDGRLARASRISTLITAMGCVCLYGLSIWAVPFFFGQEFHPAVPVIGILLLGTVLGNPGSVAGAGLSARGRPLLRSLALGFALLVSVGALFLLAPTWGAYGAAFATLIGNFAAGNLNIVWLWKVFNVRPREFYAFRKADMNELVYQTHVIFTTLRSLARR